MTPDIVQKKDGGLQIDFAIKMMNLYLSEKGVLSVGVRRLHYFIVSLPESERMIPGRGGKLHPYQNTKGKYQRLSELLVEARTKKRVESSKIIDEKNAALIEMPERQPAKTTWEVSVAPVDELPELDTDLLPNWNEWLDQITCDPFVSRPVFNNQEYRVVVAIEKATSKNSLKEICAHYGADLLIFSGQFSVTRVHDIVNRAKKEDKPILLLYISDLDCGGWVMPTAFAGRIEEIYPRPDHKMVRVALTREQAVKYRLPEAFDPNDKGYEQAQVDRFIKESGGRSCIELDALDENILLELLVTELKKYSGIELDADEYKNAHEDAYHEKKSIDLGYVGIDEFRQEYDDVATEFNQIAQEIAALSERYRDKISDLNSRKESLEHRVVDAIRDTYGFEQRDEWSG